MDIRQKIRQLPNSPGVYIMKDSSGTVLYVGKAIDLRKRVMSYFRPKATLPARIDAMVGLVDDIDHIVTSTEAEALIYENGLIKQLSPKYNVALKDGKSYPMLKLTVKEDFPRLIMTRGRKDDGAAYYGPYANAKLLRQAVILLKQIFPLRSCVRLGKRECLEFHIKQCPAPCVDRVDKAVYSETVKELKLFLDGRRKELLDTVAAKMKEASSKEDFETATVFKERLKALGSIRKDAVKYRPLGEVEELKTVLRLISAPDTIEAFDVSNIMGEAATG